MGQQLHKSTQQELRKQPNTNYTNNPTASRLQRHPQSAFNGTTAVIPIGCAPTHPHPAFNGTINPPATAPSLSKLQQWHHRCHPHRLCANSCSICPQWHPQSAFNGTTAVILIGCAPTHLHPAFNGTINPPAMAPSLSSSLAVRQHIFVPPSTAPSIRQQWHHCCQNYSNVTIAAIPIGCAPTHVQSALNGTLNPPSMAPPDRCHPHWLCANTSSSRLQRHHQSASNGTINNPTTNEIEIPAKL